jgi:hypothetical protein
MILKIIGVCTLGCIIIQRNIELFTSPLVMVVALTIMAIFGGLIVTSNNK